MGETAVETTREIEQLRSQVTEIINELERRARSAADVRSQVTARPVVSGLLAAALAGGIGGGVFFALRSARRRKEEQARIDHRMADLLELLRERVKPPVNVEIVSANGDRHKKNERRGVAVERDPGALKKILWAALTAGLMALATLLARRVSEVLWERAMHEVPPEKVVT